MKIEEIKFISDVIRPWKNLNFELSKPYAINPEMSDFMSNAISLAISIKHFLENSAGLKIKDLISESSSFEVISDLADSGKHGKLYKKERECSLSIYSMFERNENAELRFLRNIIRINHPKFGKVDFMKCALESSKFVAEKLLISTTDWNLKIIINSGKFSNEINLVASNKNQIMWKGLGIEIVKLNENGEYENVDLNGTVKIKIVPDF